MDLLALALVETLEHPDAIELDHGHLCVDLSWSHRAWHPEEKEADGEGDLERFEGVLDALTATDRLLKLG